MEHDFILVLLNSGLVLFMLGKLFNIAEELAELKERLINIETILNHGSRKRKEK